MPYFVQVSDTGCSLMAYIIRSNNMFDWLSVCLLRSSTKDETGSSQDCPLPPSQSSGATNNDRHEPHYSPPPLPHPVAPVAMTAPTIGTSSSPQPVTANSYQAQKPGPPPLLSLSSLDIAHHSPGGVSVAGVGGPLTSCSSNIIRKLPFINSTNPDTSMSLFSSSGFPTHRGQKPRVQPKPGTVTLSGICLHQCH